MKMKTINANGNPFRVWFCKKFPGLQYKTTTLINHKLASLPLVKHQVPFVQDVCLNTPDQTNIKLSVTWLYDTHDIRMDSSRHQSLHYHCVSLTHFNSETLGEVAIILKIMFSNSKYGTIAWALTVKLACFTTNQYLMQCWTIVNWILRNKIKWNLN